MKDEALARKVAQAKKVIDDSKDLSPDEREALHDSVDQAAATANGSQQKLDDLTVSHCKAVLRAARFEASFKDRVIDAVQGPLDAMRDELIEAMTKLLVTHTLNCPMNGKEAKATTWKDVALSASKNPYFYAAVAAIAFSPNAVAIIDRFMK